MTKYDTEAGPRSEEARIVRGMLGSEGYLRVRTL